MLNTQKIREDFPILKQLVHDEDLVYLDNAATSQKPKKVLDAVRSYYDWDNANAHRGLHCLGERATSAYEGAREKVRAFINAQSTQEIIFTKGTTDSLNMVANFAQQVLKQGDEILLSVAEHHANLIPWQQVCQRTGAQLRHVELKDGRLDMDDLRAKLSEKTKFVSLAHVSNVLGTLNPIKEIAELAHAVGSLVVVDAAQSAPHLELDVVDLGCDFLAFSGHKMLAPMGIGVLYGKQEILEKMPPFLSGGEMIEYVTLDNITYAELPHKFEAGTVNAGGAVGLAAAIDYIESIGLHNIEERELELTKIAVEGMQAIPHIQVLGSDDYREHHGIITFKVEGVHPHDIAAIIADANVAVRAGHHCAEPLHHFLGIPSTTRASLMFYNTEEEVQRFLDVVKQIRPMMGYPD